MYHNQHNKLRIWQRIWHKTLHWIVVWIGVVILGWSSFQGYQIWRGEKVEVEKTVSALKNSRPSNYKVLDKVPVRVKVADVGIDVPIVPGRIVDGEWQVSEKYANYLVGTGVIGRPGNVVVYAHKRRGLFANLSKSQTGQLIELESKDMAGIYRIEEIKIVEPDDLSVLEPTRVPMLTMYTCNGWKDEKRLVIRAQLIKRYPLGFSGLVQQGLSQTASQSAE